MLVGKNTCVTKTDPVVAREKDFLTTVRRGAVQTAGVVAQNRGAAPSIKHVGKITPTTGEWVVAQNGEATSSIKHVCKTSPARDDRAVVGNGNTTSSIYHLGEMVLATGDRAVAGNDGPRHH